MTDTAAKPEVKALAAAPVATPAPVAATAKAEAPRAPKADAAPVKAEPAKAAPAKADPAKPVARKPVAVAKARKPKPQPRKVPAAKPAILAAKETKMADTIKNVTDQTKTMFAEANDRAKGAMEKSARAFEDMNAFQKGNVEAIVESSKIAAKGAEAIAKYSVDYAKGAVEKANANVRKLATVKSPTEFFQLQTEFAREAMDAVASEGAKFTENYLKLLGEIAQPYQNRFAVAAEKIKVAA